MIDKINSTLQYFILLPRQKDHNLCKRKVSKIHSRRIITSIFTFFYGFYEKSIAIANIFVRFHNLF